MLSWLILIIVIAGLIMWFGSLEDKRYSDPLTKTDSGYQSSRFEQNAMNKVYASEIRPKRKQTKKVTKKKKTHS